MRRVVPLQARLALDHGAWLAIYSPPLASRSRELLVPVWSLRYLDAVTLDITAIRSELLETHGPLGTLWVGLGLCAFYIALVWINTLLGVVLTPLFIVPLTWLQDRVRGNSPARG